MSRVRNKFEGRAEVKSASPLLRPAVILSLVLIGIFSFISLFVLIGYSDDLRSKESGQATPFSRSAVGYAGLVQLLTDLEFEISQDPKPRKSDWDSRNTLRIYTPVNAFATQDLKTLDLDQPTLIILPKWGVAEIQDKPGWVRKSRFGSLMRSSRLSQFVSDAGTGIYLDRVSEADLPDEFELAIGETVARLPIEDLQHFSLAKPSVAIDDPDDIVSENAEDPLDAQDESELDTDDTFEEAIEELAEEITDIEISEDDAKPAAFDIVMTARAEAPLLAPQPLLIKLGDTRTYVLSDPDFMNTKGLATQSGARMAVDILQEIITQEDLNQNAIIFDLSIHGIGGKPNLIKLMTQPPFLAATLCLLGAGLLIAWQGFSRFGDPLRIAPDYSQGSAALAKTSAAFFSNAGRLGSMGGAYAELTRRQVIRRLGLSGMSTDIVSRRLSARETLRDITPKFDDLKHISTNEDAMGFTARARALAHWKEEMLRER